MEEPSMLEAAEMLRGRRVLIVEDELLVAMELESLLEDQGCAVVGPVPTVDRALALLDRERPDAAILDINLDGETAVPVAAALTAQGVPFLLATGYGNAQSLEPVLKDAPRVDKPVSYDRLVRTLARIIRAKAA
jgi:DNA-binding NtrC family response regulator